MINDLNTDLNEKSPNNNAEDNDDKILNSDSKRVVTTTVLSYSDKKDLSSPTTKITTASLLHREENPSRLDPNDDYYVSNQLNEVVLSSKSIELHYFVFHNDIEGVKKYIVKHKKLKHSLCDYLSIRDVNEIYHLTKLME
jgi:hypothetical protein